MTVMVIRLASSEDIIGDVSAGEGALIVKNPMTIMSRMDPETQQMRVGLMPFAPFAESESIQVYPHAVLADYEPQRDLLNEYNRMFSGIVIASSMP